MDYCKLCGNIGHKFGLCTTDIVELAFVPPRPCKSVELYCSVNGWSIGEPMIPGAQGGFTISRGFPVGTHQFKFRMDGQEWGVSDLYPVTTTNGHSNNLIQVHFKNGESVLANVDFTSGVRMTKIHILLNGISLREMFEKAGLAYDSFDNRVEVWGSWNGWAAGEEMSGWCDIGLKFTFFVLKKTLPAQPYFYKFKVQGQWMLDPYREVQEDGPHLNHVLRFKAEIEFDLREMNKPLIAPTPFRVTALAHEKLRDFDLVGHSLTNVGGKLFMFGGKDRDSFTNNLFRIELEPFKVKQMHLLDSNGPSPIGFHKALKYGEKLIIYGGHDNKSVSNSYHTYSTLRNAWTSYKFVKPLLREMYSVVYRRFTSRIYIFGGLFCSPDDEAEIHYNDLHVLFLNVMQFRRLKTRNPPCGRFGHSAVLFNWTMFLFGGCQTDGLRKVCFNDLYKIDLFDHDELEWEKVSVDGPRPSPRYGHLCVHFGTQMVVYGGYNEKMLDNLLGDIWVFEVRRGTWVEVAAQSGELDLRRAFHAGAILNGSLIVFGGKMAKKNQLVDKFLKIEFDFN